MEDTTTLKLSNPKLSRELILHNMGGWIKEGDLFYGAAVFKYETGKAFGLSWFQGKKRKGASGMAKRK